MGGIQIWRRSITNHSSIEECSDPFMRMFLAEGSSWRIARNSKLFLERPKRMIFRVYSFQVKCQNRTEKRSLSPHQDRMYARTGTCDEPDLPLASLIANQSSIVQGSHVVNHPPFSCGVGRPKNKYYSRVYTLLFRALLCSGIFFFYISFNFLKYFFVNS